MDDWMKILLGGLVGALIAAIFTIVVDIWRERLRLRMELMLDILAWVAEMTRSLNRMQVELAEAFRAKSWTATLPEASRFFTDRVPAPELTNRSRLLYGEDCELPDLINSLGDCGVQISLFLSQADGASWPSAEQRYDPLMTDEFSPRSRRLLDAARTLAAPPWWLLRL